MRIVLDQFKVLRKDGKEAKFVLQKNGGKDYRIRLERDNRASIRSAFETLEEAKIGFNKLKARYAQSAH